ncbi:MAG: molybdenum cofactor guanylyltransferase [Cellvibrionaceae bacterium]|nr:molybdenum cofactor guanylyltransferase [Cellvibrionaceae bacterium]
MSNETTISRPSPADNLNRSLACAVIAGGASRRLGGIDKCLLPLGDKSLLEHILGVLSAGNTTVLINTNRNLAHFQALQLPIISDTEVDHSGPIAGIIACLSWLRANCPEVQWLLTSGGDTPFLPANYVARFISATAKFNAGVVYAEYRSRYHYLNSAWHVSSLQPLLQLKALGKLSLKEALSRFEHRRIDFSDQVQDPFFNINTPEDYKLAKQKIVANLA